MSNGLGPIPGVPGSLWTAFLASVQYMGSNLDPTHPDAGLPLVDGTLKSYQGILDALTVWQLFTYGQPAFNVLAQSQAYAVKIDSATNSFLSNRINAFSAFMGALAPNVVPIISKNINDLNYGKSVVTSQSMIDFFMGFNYETPPTGLTAANFVAQAQAAATAWSTFSNALVTQGVSYQGSAYDAIMLMGSCSELAANTVLKGSDISATNLTQSWNLLVALPAISAMISAYFSDPTSLLCQQTAIMRLTIQNTIVQLNQMLISLRTKQTSNIQLGTVRNDQTLMDMAARDLGDYESWQQIANANNLMPPYMGNGTALADPGTQIYLSGNKTSQTPNYAINYLGVDWFLGPINEPMLPWTGDLNTISGYSNLSLSLGRRLQTTIGSLMYHPSFGSRIPPEIGKIMSSQTAGHITAYASSAILSDPRVQKIINANVSLMPNGAVQYDGIIIPNGLGGSAGISVNEVLLPLA